MRLEQWIWRWRWKWRWENPFYRGFCSKPISVISQSESVQVQHMQTLCGRGQLQEALSLFYAINIPHSQAYGILLQGCAQHRLLYQGRALHQHMLSNCHNPDLFVTNHLINFYAKCGCLEVARQLFDQMPHRNLVSWTALITGYSQHDRPEDCFQLFSYMLAHHRPTEFAFASVLSSCDCFRGRQVHALVLKTSFDAYVYVANALITMYSKSLHCNGAWAVFQTMSTRGLITWNSMLAGFQLCGHGAQSLDLFSRMHRDGVGFDRATFLSVISSLYSEGNDIVVGLKHCYQLHCLASKTGFVSQVEVATALMNAYSKLGGDLSECYKLFDETIGCQDLVLWTGIITSCVEQKPEQALLLFRQLRREGINPDCYTFSAVVKACAGFATEQHGSAIHSQVIKAGFEEDTVLANALIHAYARCGSLHWSEQIFNRMEFPDTVSWNSIFKAYALHGRAVEALQLFEQMNVQPDAATFVALLTACSHAGLVVEGTKIFDMMVQKYGIYPERDHFACMVDILGRAGHLLEAEALIYRMPMQPDSVVWSALLGACRKHREPKLAELAGRKLLELDPKNSIGYVLMSNIYSSEGCFHNAAFIRKEMKGNRVRKEPGLSWIEVENQVHEFACGGQRHPQRKAISAQLELLVGKLKGMGYVPETNSALHDIGEEHKEELLFYHSEKLALAFVVMNSGQCDRKTIRIMKNIRICLDCHNFMKLASDLLQREILVRDSNRFHHFRDGLCSCSDYW